MTAPRHPDGVADLHLHTTASDGTSSVAERRTQARDRGLTDIAITDHDRIGDALEGRVDRTGSVTCITGVEIRADLLETKIELLGYFVSPANTELTDVLRRAREYRRDRNREMLDRLNEVTRLGLEYEALAETVSGSLGRPHVAQRLVDRGVVDSIQAAFDEFLAPGGSAYVPMDRVPATEVIEAIDAADGLAVLAHPGRIRSDLVPEMVVELASMGLAGIEVWYPYEDRGDAVRSGVDVERASELAAEYGLLRTGGSDCHGPGSGQFRIGSVRVPATALAELYRAAGLPPED